MRVGGSPLEPVMGKLIDSLHLVCYRTYQVAASQALALRARPERLLPRSCEAAWPFRMGLTGQWCVSCDGGELLAVGDACSKTWRGEVADRVSGHHRQIHGVCKAPARVPSSGPSGQLGESTLEAGASVSQMGPTKGGLIRTIGWYVIQHTRHPWREGWLVR